MNYVEAMKQMVEALEAYQHNGSVQLFDEAITTGRQAIAEAEKQVAFKIYKPTPPRGAIPNVRDAELLPWVYDQDPSSGIVASMWVTPVKSTPQPKREWVWLTPEEITALKHNGKRYISSQDFARAVEALSKEKNSK